MEDDVLVRVESTEEMLAASDELSVVTRLSMESILVAAEELFVLTAVLSEPIDDTKLDEAVVYEVCRIDSSEAND